MTHTHAAFPLCIADNLDYTDTNATMPFSMSGDKVNDVEIPAVFMQKDDVTWLRELMSRGESVMVLLTWLPSDQKGAAQDGAEPSEGGDKTEEEPMLRPETSELDFKENLAEIDRLISSNGEDGSLTDNEVAPSEGNSQDQNCKEKKKDDTSSTGSCLDDDDYSSEHEYES